MESIHKQLISARQEIKKFKQLTFYTDGSLNNKYIMGQIRIGWLLTEPPTCPALHFIADTD
jgi:hypothetical protein